MNPLPIHRIGQILVCLSACTLSTLSQPLIPETPLRPGDSALLQQFGWAVAADGETVVIGAPSDSPSGFFAAGAVYVFVREGDLWAEQAKLVAADAAWFSQFGYAVAIKGDTILVGAPYDGASAGAAYVFARSGNAWAQQAKLTPLDAVPGQEFGCAVALDVDRLVVGAMLDAEGGYNAGAAYAFEPIDTSWAQTAKLVSDLPQPGDLFGFAVALAGDTVVVGSPFDDAAGIDAGAVYVFTLTESRWSQEAELFASDAAASDVLGWSVAIANDWVLAGAPQKAGNAESEGAAYVFRRVGRVWSPEVKLVASDAQVNDHFGYAVALRDTMAAIGAPLDSSAGDIAGAAYLFQHDGSLWGEIGELSAAEVRPGDQFGFSVALADRLLAVGAPYNNQITGLYNGAAYAFPFSAPNSPPVADASATVGEVISPNNRNAEVLLDGSRSTDADGDALAFEWICEGRAISTTELAGVVLSTGTHEIILSVHDGQASNQDVITVQVITAAAATRALGRLVAQAGLPAARERQLMTILRVAERSFRNGRMNAGSQQLGVLQKIVLNGQGRRLDPATANLLVGAAQRIIDAVPHR